jgi:glycosidase
MKRTNVILISALIAILLVAIAAMVIAAITLANVSTNKSRDSGSGTATTTSGAPATTTSESSATTTGGPPVTTTSESSATTTSKPPAPDLEWWKSTPIYQVYPRSFQDSDGDGTGDLVGIKSRIPYLRDLGIKAIWLSPVYESPMADFGYDISNFTNIAPIFGTLQDFNDLVTELHKNDMYIIMDFVPNHSSNQHEWFEKSERGEDPYKDYYVWRDQPNNWISIFGNSSWEYSETRKQYYLHQFLIQQPDLNYRNELLKKEMLDTLKFWVDHGVDGFRIDAILYLVEDLQFRDEPRSYADVPPNNHAYLIHNYTQDLPETYAVVANWTKFFRQYGQEKNKHIFTCTEGYTDVVNVMKYYAIGVDFPFNFNLIPLDGTTSASTLRKWINDWMNFMPAGSWPNWVLGNHDQHRVASRLGGRQYIDIANMLLLLLPGTPTCYYGDEIGMINANISYQDSVDPAGCNWGPDDYMNFSRDPERTPMQWDTSEHSGFSKNTTWLPLGDDWKTFNVEQESKDPNSHLSIFKALVKLRKEPVFRVATNLRLINLNDENVFVFTRELSTDSRYLIVLNFGHDGKPAKIDYGLGTGTGEIVIRSSSADYPLGQKIDFDQPFNISDAHGYVIKLL